jgi:hypothetical protein
MPHAGLGRFREHLLEFLDRGCDSLLILLYAASENKDDVFAQSPRQVGNPLCARDLAFASGPCTS